MSGMDSRYLQYLDTNYVPTVSETQDIQSILQDCDEKISDLDTQMNKLLQQLNVLRQQRADTYSFSEKHRALLSPMRKLGRDVLEEIFLACLPTHRNPCMSATEAPVLLTRICSTWRQVALSTPRIWAKIHIPFPVIKGESGTIYTVGFEDLVEQEALLSDIISLRERAVDEWLKRSGTCPLSISIIHPYVHLNYYGSAPIEQKFNAVCGDLRTAHVSFIQNTIVPHQRRLKEFDICIPNDTFSGILDIGLNKEDLHMLESLHVTNQITEYDLQDLPPSHSDFPHRWNDTVSLMSMNTYSATIDCFPIRNSDMQSISNHSWGNLTELNMTLYEEEDESSTLNVYQFAASILRYCHSLIVLKLALSSGRFTNPEAFQFHDTLVLQHLTTLNISLRLMSDALAFANALYLPAIKNLGIRGNFCDGVSKGILRQIIKSLLRASGDCHKLTIYDPYRLCSNDLIDLLKITPALRSLHISTHPVINERWLQSRFHPHRPQTTTFAKSIDDGLLRALTTTATPNSDIICPMLEEFDCGPEIVTNISENCLKDFVISRANDERVVSLRRISLFVNHYKQFASNKEPVQLGPDSAVYFKKPQKISHSPFDGFEHGTNLTSSMDYYNYL